MTHRKDFKKLVRARMAQTNETYTTAKRHVEAAAEPSDLMKVSRLGMDAGWTFDSTKERWSHPVLTKGKGVPLSRAYLLEGSRVGKPFNQKEDRDYWEVAEEFAEKAGKESGLGPVGSPARRYLTLPCGCAVPNKAHPKHALDEAVFEVNGLELDRYVEWHAQDRCKLPPPPEPPPPRPETDEERAAREQRGDEARKALEAALASGELSPEWEEKTRRLLACAQIDFTDADDTDEDLADEEYPETPEVVAKENFSEWLLQPGLPEYLRDHRVPENAVALTKAVAQALKEGRLQPFFTDTGLHRKLPSLNLPNNVLQPYDALCDLADVWSSMRPSQKAVTFDSPPLTPNQEAEVQALRNEARTALTQEAHQILKDLKARDAEYGGTPVHSAQTSGYKYVLWAHLPQGTQLVTEGPSSHPKGLPHYVLPTGHIFSFQEADRWVASRDLATQLVYTPPLSKPEPEEPEAPESQSQIEQGEEDAREKAFFVYPYPRDDERPS